MRRIGVVVRADPIRNKPAIKIPHTIATRIAHSKIETDPGRTTATMTRGVAMVTEKNPNVRPGVRRRQPG
jgi:hypothetical protein